MEQLNKAEREAIVASIKKGKPLSTANCLENAVKWSDKHPATKPHFLIATDDGHVIVY